MDTKPLQLQGYIMWLKEAIFGILFQSCLLFIYEETNQITSILINTMH